MFSDAVIDNSRYESRLFTIPVDTLVHGFAAYFDCVLYKEVTLSEYSTKRKFVGVSSMTVDHLVAIFRPTGPGRELGA